MAELETTMAPPPTEAAGARPADAAPQPAGLQLEAEVKSEVSSPSKLRQVRHTRSCNGRDMCSCMLRVESAYFQKNLVEKAVKKRRMDSVAFAVVARARPRKYQRITNIQQFSLEIKHHLAAFLGAVGLARLGMRATSELLANESRLEHLLSERRPRPKESWSRFMHAQMTCVHKLFVYYTGYKTGPMRQQFPHWAFGVVYVDPNVPHRIILPNAWTFHGHNPWIRQRANGKDGEWQLRGTYKSDKAPKDFQLRVKEWASTIRPGSLLAIAVSRSARTSYDVR
ncbi:hypothetical protein BBJ28_00018638 [Nothophytophthora sp. Chile5]|nr:hypothetical protein BBJ28_00018638 [Nothophytophthora sp. Chile5]